MFALDEYHLDVIFFAILVIFVAWTCMQGQIVAGVRLFLGEISLGFLEGVDIPLTTAVVAEVFEHICHYDARVPV